ncbi:uncharacterized protein LOC117120672 [Anneissia japonica]|uniref:uncharacterized protein LOC117120672 n=1 Tax=Anneissia japonica TaxID=1529436 RepID=UPI001425966D|nr:uncharacterized protein LOC117120672 [Anneissia japonica]
MKVLSSECMHNTRLLTLISLTFYVKLTSTAHPGSSYGDNVVFMYEEKSAQFKPSCKCHIEGTETSHFHKLFKLEEDGPMYDLCYAGSYVAEITPTKAVCKPCITGTYNPSSNACSYCLMCRTCGEFENSYFYFIADHQEECNGSLVEIPRLTEDNKKTIADKSLSDHVIELLVKEIGKDYRTIGIALGLTPAKLDRIEMDNKNQNIINAFRNMLLAARQMHSPNKQCEVFIKAFQDCNRRDLADIIIKNVATESGRVDLAIADPENGTDKCLKYPTEEADERRSTTSSSHSCS